MESNLPAGPFLGPPTARSRYSEGGGQMVAQNPLHHRTAKVTKVPAKRVRELLLELTYRLHATKVVKRPSRKPVSQKRGPSAEGTFPFPICLGSLPSSRLR
jgi:hypothetical protein